MCITTIIRRAKLLTLQNEKLWRNLSTAAMFSGFDGRFQQQGFNPHFSSSFNHHPGKESSLFRMERTESGSEIEQLESPGAWIKMGLKKKITLKHLEKGTAIPKIEEPKIEPPKPRIKEEEDPEVLRKRRERNKVAATKCRKRKRERIEKLEKKTSKLEQIRRQKEQERAKLIAEMQQLTTCLRNHCCKFTSTTSGADQSLLALQDPALLNSFRQMYGNFSEC